MRYLILLAFLATAHARAVNISNAWVLPEEGFPVFYRYFRDRISWYEADAVCQFHHANLVTVDTTAQYDAVRAYLKELDISSAVWVGLIRSNPEGDFTWTDYRGLSGDGYWSSAPDPRIAPLCAAANPAADYRWEARACGGPTVASFICELPVPQWALGNEGCMIRALPALTILYLPESAAVQLTADCGLAGVKRLQCTGNVKREDLLRDLSCTEEVELSSPSNNLPLSSSSVTEATTTTENQDTPNGITMQENLTTENENDDNQSGNTISTPFDVDKMTEKSLVYKILSTVHPALLEINKIVVTKNTNLDEMQSNNVQSNDIPNLVNNGNFLTNYRIEKIEDEENMQHKKLHDELARLGNFETIFTQPTDHFVPPLVIAKARLIDDMTVLSLKEKHAQHFGTHNMLKHSKEQNNLSNVKALPVISTIRPDYSRNSNLVEASTEETIKLKDELKKDNTKNALPKKYTQKVYDSKISSILKGTHKKENTVSKVKKNSSASNESLQDSLYSSSTKLVETASSRTATTSHFDDVQNDELIDLTVTLQESNGQNEFIAKVDDTDEIYVQSEKNESEKNITDLRQPEIDVNTETINIQTNTSKKYDNIDNVTYDHGITNSTVRNDNTSFDAYLTILDVTTKMPVFKDDLDNPLFLKHPSTTDASLHNMTNISDTAKTKYFNLITETPQHETTSVGLQYIFSNSSSFLPISTITESSSTKTTAISYTHTETLSTTVATLNHSKNNDNFSSEIYTTNIPNTTMIETFNVTENIEEMETIDDYQSPLLSAANEPLQRPNRLRRPKTPQNRINKFNPFRILG